MCRLIRPRTFSSRNTPEGAAVPAAERLDGVDLRVGVPDIDVPNVVATFGLDRRDAREGVIHLLDNLSGAAAHPATGATARLERAPRAAEVLVQVRPARRTRLSPRWTAFRSDAVHQLRITEEWMAAKHILVAACTASLDDGYPAAAAVSIPVPAGITVRVTPGQDLLSARQRDFLAECAGLVMPTERLTLIGPIRERTWTFQYDDLDFQIRRWTARAARDNGRLDLVDLEIQTSVTDAPFLFPALRSLAGQHGVDTEAAAHPLAIRALTWAAGLRR
jgi:hypothetical protein